MVRCVLMFVFACVLMSTPLRAVGQEPPARGAQAERAAAPVNLNTATAQELEALPGIGAATAARILEYRQKNGAFKKIEDLMNVKGIGERSFLKLKALVTVAPARGERQGTSLEREH